MKKMFCGGEGTMDVFWNSTHYKGDSVQKCAFPNLHCMCVIHSNLKTTISTRKKA